MLPTSRRHTLLVSRFSSNAVFMVDDIVVVATFNTDRTNGVSELLSGHMNLHMRAYYPDPDAAPLNAVVHQKRVLDVHRGTALETFHIGVVPPVLASRERLVVSTYVPHIIPRCLMNKGMQVGTPPLSVANGLDDLRRMGVCDLPFQSSRIRPAAHNGMPVALVELCFDRLRDERIGEAYLI